MTLTLDQKNCSAKDSIKHIKACWNKMRTYLKRKYGRSISFISVIELQKNGYAHLHVLVDQYIAQSWLTKAWDDLGGGRIVDIRFIDIHRVAGYISKYLTKDMFMGNSRVINMHLICDNSECRM